MDIQKPDISVILPVYNVEKYLVKCLDSISNQKFSGTFEIIAVEASSTDNSLVVLKSYQEREPRLKIIEHGTREKLSTSRVTGIGESRGDYIMHVDSDDRLLPGALEILYRTCLETDADIVVFDYIREEIKGKRLFFNNIKKKLVTTDKLEVQIHFYGACWNKIVRRSLSEKLIYGEVGATTTEDLPYSIEILLKAEKICLIPDPFYVYFVNTDSSSFSIKGEQYFQNQIVILSQLQRILTSYNASQVFIENVMDYFEKWIYLELVKIQFWKRGKLSECSRLIRELFLLHILNEKRIRHLESAIENRFICLNEVARRFNLRLALGIIRRSFLQ